MTATLVNTTNSTSIAGTTLVVNLPATPVVGNLLVMAIGCWGGATFAGLTGWTQRTAVSGTSMQCAIYTRVVDGTEPASYTITGFTASADPRMASVLQISGHGGHDVSVSLFNTATGTSPWATIPNVTTTVADTLLIRGIYSQSQINTIVWTWSGTTTPVADFYTAASGGWLGHQSVIRQTLPAAGSSPAATVSRSTAASSSNNHAMFTVAIKPGTVAPPSGVKVWNGTTWVAANRSVRSSGAWVAASKTHLSPPASSGPTITSISPNPGPAGAVTVNGTNFIAPVTVSVGGAAATGVSVVSSTQLTCTAPAHADGAVNVTVTASGGTSASFVFTYQATPSSVNRPANPGAIVYGSGLTNAAAWAHPGAIVIAGRDNYDGAWAKTIAAGGGTVLVYLDTIINASYGRYHDKLINASEFGPAVPKWPGNPVANSTGSLNDFRVGGILQSKLAGVLSLILSENSHVGGIFLDDCGSRSWYPNFDWTTIDREAYRAGAINIVQTTRATIGDLFIMVNGTWSGTSSSGVGDGGYPDKTKSGISLADGGFVENHSSTGELAAWTAYSTSTQWASATSRGKAYTWFQNTGSVSDRNNWVNANVAAFASTADYGDSSVVPWTSFTDFGLPHGS